MILTDGIELVTRMAKIQKLLILLAFTQQIHYSYPIKVCFDYDPPIMVMQSGNYYGNPLAKKDTVSIYATGSIMLPNVKLPTGSLKKVFLYMSRLGEITMQIWRPERMPFDMAQPKMSLVWQYTITPVDSSYDVLTTIHLRPEEEFQTNEGDVIGWWASTWQWPMFYYDSTTINDAPIYFSNTSESVPPLHSIHTFKQLGTGATTCSLGVEVRPETGTGFITTITEMVNPSMTTPSPTTITQLVDIETTVPIIKTVSQTTDPGATVFLASTSEAEVTEAGIASCTAIIIMSVLVVIVIISVSIAISMCCLYHRRVRKTTPKGEYITGRNTIWIIA